MTSQRNTRAPWERSPEVKGLLLFFGVRAYNLADDRGLAFWWSRLTFFVSSFCGRPACITVVARCCKFARFILGNISERRWTASELLFSHEYRVVIIRQFYLPEVDVIRVMLTIKLFNMVY